MKVVLLAGGKGTRLGEETQYRPKPMVEIGEKPILWHIMQRYAKYGHEEFIICCGYKGYMIKEYFLNYHKKYSNIGIDMHTGKTRYMNDSIEPWKVTMVNTGLETLTAGRIKMIKDFLGDDEEFLLTYGDGVGDVNIDELVDFHRKNGKIVTISVTKPDGRFGAVKFDDNTKEIHAFQEKAREDQSFVNIGFMVCNKKIFDYLGDGSEMLERGPFEKLAADKQMAAYEHPGFWSPMDNIKDKEYLTGIYEKGNAPWLA